MTDGTRSQGSTGGWLAQLERATGKIVIVAAIFVVAAFVVMAIGGADLAPYSATAQSLGRKLRPPDSTYWFGTDQLGRDIFSRIVIGARSTAIVAATCILIGGTVGGFLGILAGYFGGRTDALVMRFADATLSFPTVLLALIFATTHGPGLTSVVATISILIWARFARVVRAAAASIRSRDWVKQARVNGCSHLYIMARHVFPHVLDTWMVMASLQLGAVLILEATLGFLGVGVPPPAPSWGQMTAAGRSYLVEAWWVSLIPAMVLSGIIIAFAVIGDWVRDRLDPRSGAS